MGWETRRGRRYFYLSDRIGDRIFKRYIGNGPMAEAAEQLAALAAQDAADEAAAIRQIDDQLDPLTVMMDELDRGCRRLIAATLLAAGYHEQHRSWRKNRARPRTDGPDGRPDVGDPRGETPGARRPRRARDPRPER